MKFNTLKSKRDKILKINYKLDQFKFVGGDDPLIPIARTATDIEIIASSNVNMKFKFLRPLPHAPRLFSWITISTVN